MILTSPTQATPAWLTTVLTRSGALTAGAVTAVDSGTGRGNWSQNANLTLTYSPAAAGEQPVHLFLKMVDTDTGDGEFFLPSEVTYYTRDYIDLPDAPLVRCYDAAYDPLINRYHLLLDDKSATHKAAYDVTPSLKHGRALAEALAILHAHWWGPERLEESGAAVHDAAHIRRFVDIGRPGMPPAFSTFAGQLKPHWPALITQIFEALPDALIERAKDRTHFTRLHGDPNPGNMLVPKEGDRPLYLIDQQPFDWSLTTWLGVDDLAYVMALFWPLEHRRALERPILRHYHEVLQRRGIQSYSWAQLFDDYRLSAALTVPRAVEYMRDGGDPEWNSFRLRLIERSVTAVEELGSVELL